MTQDTNREEDIAKEITKTQGNLSIVDKNKLASHLYRLEQRFGVADSKFADLEQRISKLEERTLKHGERLHLDWASSDEVTLYLQSEPKEEDCITRVKPRFYSDNNGTHDREKEEDWCKCQYVTGTIVKGNSNITICSNCDKMKSSSLLGRRREVPPISKPKPHNLHIPLE